MKTFFAKSTVHVIALLSTCSAFPSNSFQIRLGSMKGAALSPVITSDPQWNSFHRHDCHYCITSSSVCLRSRPSNLLERTDNSNNNNSKEYVAVQLNAFFRNPVPDTIRPFLDIRVDDDDDGGSKKPDPWSIVTAPPTIPGTPRPLWLTIVASLPTGLLWYGYYKFCVEEELHRMELAAGKEPRGFGGYGTLAPFTYGILLGVVAELFHLPGGKSWAGIGIAFIYYTQFLLYDRLNDLYREEEFFNDEEEERGTTTKRSLPPLTVWWCLPIFFPFNIIVGLRQIHFLSEYMYRQRGIQGDDDPVVRFFPFIGADNFTWQEFLTTPSLWCRLLHDQKDIPREDLPDILQKFLSIGEKVD